MKGKSRIFTVIPSAALGATTSYDLGGIPGDWDEIVGYLVATAVSGTTPTLDVKYQTTPDGGTTYVDHTTFTQVTAASTEKKTFTAPAGVSGKILCTIGGSATPTVTFALYLECKRNS
jgi:hypothetical protein